MSNQILNDKPGPEMQKIIWTDYIQYRARLRGFELGKTEEIVRYSSERYFDNATQRSSVIGKHDNRLVIISYEQDEDAVVPVTIHATTRQQVKFRLQTKRFTAKRFTAKRFTAKRFTAKRFTAKRFTAKRFTE